MGRPIPETRAVLGGISALLLTLGIARFAYTPLLPTMQLAVEGFGEFRGGILAAGNYLGYLGGALVASRLSDIRIKDRIYRWSLPLAVATTGAMAITTGFTAWMVLRALSGFTSAAGLVICSGLVMNHLSRRGERLRMGPYFGGVGLGLALSAAAVALLSNVFDWREQWIALAMMGIPLAWLAHAWVPRPAPLPRCSSPARPDHVPPEYTRRLQAAYFAAGFGYVVVATFLVDMFSGLPRLAPVAELSWILVGAAAAPSCMVWERVAERSSELEALTLAYLLQILGILLPVTHPTPVTALIGAALFGATFMGIVSLVLTMAGRLYPGSPAKPMGKLTLSFGVAQIIGPAVAGWLAGLHGGYHLPMLIAAAVLALGIWPLRVLMRGPEDDGGETVADGA